MQKNYDKHENGQALEIEDLKTISKQQQNQIKEYETQTNKLLLINQTLKKQRVAVGLQLAKL